MKADQFCYWLQGLFELADPKNLNMPQTKIIKDHLAMVAIHDPEDDGFCKWLSDLFAMVNPQTCDGQITHAIRAKLAQEFEHVIDPTYPAEQQSALNSAHHGKAQKPLMRC